MINKPGGDILDEIYEFTCRANLMVNEYIKKVFKRESSAKVLPTLLYYKVLFSRYKRVFKKELKRSEKIKDQEPYLNTLRILEQSLYKEYGTPEELEKRLQQFLENLQSQ